jgi:hypothetical protein
MKASLAGVVAAIAGLSTVACGPESSPGSESGGTGGNAGSGTSAGTGGSAGASGGAGGVAGSGQGGTSGMAGSSVAESYGLIQFGTLLHYPVPNRNSPLARAQFYRRREVLTGPVCQRTEMGPCAVTDCRVMVDPPEQEPPVPDPRPAPDAGTVTIRSTGDFTADLVPDGTGVYGQVGVMGHLLGEESVTVTAAGGDVPAFTHTMAYPLLLLLTRPEFDDVQTEYAVSRADDLVLTWDRGTAAHGLQIQTLGSTASLGCSFPGDAGTGTISSGLLAILDQGAELVLLGVQTEMVTAGEYEVSMSSAGSVMTPDRTRRAKIVLE